MSVQQEPQTADEWKAAYFRMMEMRNTAQTALAQAERELAEYEGIEGRCKVGHNKKFSYELEGEPGCVACERDAAQAEVERLTAEHAAQLAALRVTWEAKDAALARVRAALVQIEGCASDHGGVLCDCDPSWRWIEREARAALEGRG